MDDRRILIAEDDPLLAEMFRDRAEQVGLPTAGAATLAEFKERYAETVPIAVLLDLRFADGDGVELIRFLAGERYKAPILITSDADKRTLSTAALLAEDLGLSVMAKLEKPFARDRLDKILAGLTCQVRGPNQAELRRAISENELFLDYQPKVELDDAGNWPIVGVEALVRWKCPACGILGPDDFLPAMTEHGLMAELTELVIAEALAQMQAWRGEGVSLSMAVNLDPSLLTDCGLPDRIANKLIDTVGAGAPLILEITESGAMANPRTTMDILTRLRLKGIQVSMDDFGTGHSSLIQLYRMPFSEMKIDRSFVMDIGSSEEARAIVRMIVDLARELHIDVCAEGVEDQETAEYLRSVGCGLAQGYYFSRPTTADEVLALVRSRPRAPEERPAA